MSEFSNLLNAFASHINANNVESFIKLTENLIILGVSAAAHATNPALVVAEVLADVGETVASLKSLPAPVVLPVVLPVAPPVAPQVPAEPTPPSA